MVNTCYRIFGIGIIFFAFICSVNAQNRYWVFFKNKEGVKFDPFQYFDNKAIERRLKNNIPLCDSTDFPLNAGYVNIVKEVVTELNCQLRWFNAVSVTASLTQLLKLEQLPFVKMVLPIASGKFILTGSYDTLLQKEDLELWEKQISSLQGELFGKFNFTGNGFRIAVFDAGFPTVDVNPAFAHLRKNNRIIATWDFAKNRPDVYAYNPHGTMVLSCIAGIINNKKIGLATDAEFLLARTEIDRESFAEEENWLKAVEWADKNGADIISSSLAYTHERYYTFEMDGHTSLISKAANMAANKGILVVNSLGNDGNRDWKVMATPADADSVLSVGAISPVTGYHANFSSYGPTSKFKMKPNIVAFGQLIVANENQLEKVKGTSFSAPLISGFAACAWQVMPYLSNMQLFEKIEQSATLYPYFDYAHGFGMPQASFFLQSEVINETETTFQFIEKDDSVFIEIDDKFIDRKFLQNNNYLYYHIENNNSYLDDYWLIDVYQKNAAAIAKKDYPNGKIFRAHYKGFTNSFDLNKSR